MHIPYNIKPVVIWFSEYYLYNLKYMHWCLEFNCDNDTASTCFYFLECTLISYIIYHNSQYANK